jgi:hypothetical protein
MKCRNCKADLNRIFANLGASPPSNSYINAGNLNEVEKYYPLRVMVCELCWLVQTEDFVNREEFFSSTYAYFSSYSPSWLEHAKAYVEKVADRFALSEESFVVEVASNDGYLLQYVKDLEIPCLGIEPTNSTAKVSLDRGIPTICSFFGKKLANEMLRSHEKPNLIIANNVLAHVPDVHDFLSGFKILLDNKGVATFEVPYLLNLIDKNQFDTIYHEHYSYFSCLSLKDIFSRNGLDIFDIEEQSTHGGSLRVYVKHQEDISHPIQPIVQEMINAELSRGVNQIELYKDFQDGIIRAKSAFLSFLLEAQKTQKTVVGYAAAAKGNTLLNYSGVRSDLITFVVDKNPNKQGKFLPGSQIPIKSEDELIHHRPDYVVLLAWNLRDEIASQLSYIKSWGGQLVIPLPELLLI